MAGDTTMLQIAELAPERLEAAIGKWQRAVKAGNSTSQARTTLNALLLEKERRHIAALTDEQLAAAISRYEKKASVGNQGAAKVLKRLTKEQTRRPAVGGASRASSATVPATVPRMHQQRVEGNGKTATNARGLKYTRVGGWLLFYCICLTILAPLLTTGMFFAGVSEASQYFDRFPGLQGVCVLDGLLSAGVVAFGIYAGVSLWTIKQCAVDIAKAYLVVFLISSAISNLVLPLLAGLPAEATGAVLKGGLRAMIWPYIGFSIWNSYLNKSKRVKATFGRR